MPQYRRVGDVPRKRHIVHEVDGARTFEQLMGNEGFSGASSLLYHRCSPSAITSIEPGELEEPVFAPNSPLRPHHLRTPAAQQFEGAGQVDAFRGRRALLGNANVTISYAWMTASSDLYRDAVGDELAYVQSGECVLESVFGRLAVGAGDYVVIPMSTTHRWVLAEGAVAELLIISSSGHITVPARYLNTSGQLVEGAPYSERDVRGPDDELLHVAGAEIPVQVRTRAGWSRHVHATHPFDVVGWDGCLYPWALNIADFEPIVGRIHQPPPVHQTFAGPGFVVCSFVPRLFDFDEHAVKVPYHHANVDTDEVLFYSDGDFMSRAGSGIGVGSISLHPAGFVHGPQPGSHERSLGVDRTGETAVMLDAFTPLGLTDLALAISDPQYPTSWGRSPGS